MYIIATLFSHPLELVGLIAWTIMVFHGGQRWQKWVDSRRHK